jgi:TolA-binding protein
MIIPVKYPDSEFAPEAYYKGAKVNEHLARYSGKKGDMLTASVSYQDMAGKYPDSSFADDALYRAGLIEDKAGNKEKARELLMRVVDKYPGSELAGDAREKLREMPVPAERIRKEQSGKPPFNPAVEKQLKKMRPTPGK